MMKTLAFISILALSHTVVIATESLVTKIVGPITDSKDKLVGNGKAEQLVDETYPDKFLSLSTLATLDDLLRGKCDAQEQSNDEVLSPDTNLNAVEMSHESRTRNILDEVFDNEETRHNGELLAVHRSLDSKNGTILSFGANDGTELLELLRRFPNSQAWGYEIDKKTVEENQGRLKWKGVYEFTSKFTDLPEHGFDFIACNFVMFCKMSSSQFEGYMKTFGKLLKKDGMLELVVYDNGATPKSGFDARLIRLYTDKYPTQPMVDRSIDHPGLVFGSASSTLLPRQDTSIQQMRKMSHMKLFMLWPNRGSGETPKSALETPKKHPRGAQGSLFLMPEAHTSIPEGL